MNDVRALYDRALKDLAKSTAYARIPPRADRRERGSNPACGDRIELGLRLTADAKTGAMTLEDIGFEASACVLCLASANVLCRLVHRSTGVEASRVTRALTAWFDDPCLPPPFEAARPLAAVALFPARIPCVRLPWTALERALALAATSPFLIDPPIDRAPLKL